MNATDSFSILDQTSNHGELSGVFFCLFVFLIKFKEYENTSIFYFIYSFCHFTKKTTFVTVGIKHLVNTADPNHNDPMGQSDLALYCMPRCKAKLLFLPFFKMISITSCLLPWAKKFFPKWGHS